MIKLPANRFSWSEPIHLRQAPRPDVGPQADLADGVERCRSLDD